MTAHDYHVGDRVRRVRGHPMADYRPTGKRGTVVGITPNVPPQPDMVQVRWDDDRRELAAGEIAYHPDVLEPLAAIERLGELAESRPEA